MTKGSEDMLCVECGGFHEPVQGGECPIAQVRGGAQLVDAPPELLDASKALILSALLAASRGAPRGELVHRVMRAAKALCVELDRCPECRMQVYGDFERHVAECRSDPPWRCPGCNATFRGDAIETHKKNKSCVPFYKG